MDYELIFWIAVGAISLFFLIGAAFAHDETIDITWGKERDWAREERKWM